MSLRPLMLVGTGSDVGKSVLAAGFCRLFRQDGYSPAPFKAQNMALNSFATPEGGEIGRAQAVQAEACGLSPHTDMNPVLLKPTADQTAQVILHGRPVGNQSAREYFRSGSLKLLFPEVCTAYDRLSASHNPIVLEGAGSISEVNLWDRDIVNLPMARHAGAAVYLVADIDRGGVFGSVVGSLALLPPEDRALIKGILVNKFRGDRDLFRDGERQLAELSGCPVVGVLPFLHDLHIEAEDSVCLENIGPRPHTGRVHVAVVLLRHMSNFTDFDALSRDPRVHLYYARNPEDLARADLAILPGSKNTIGDLLDLHLRGMVQAIRNLRDSGKTVIGICGGYQMLGLRVEDPQGLEGDIPLAPGIGLLPVVTRLREGKRTRQTGFTFRGGRASGRGYEIHCGETVPESLPQSPVNRLDDGTDDGFFLDSRCWGTYLHGILDGEEVRSLLLDPIAAEGQTNAFDYAAFKESQYDALAEALRLHADIPQIYSHLRGQA